MITIGSPSDVLPLVPQTGATHPLGSRARVLLTSVFGPYAQDDEYGSRLLNPMELWHNQVTRVQGPFSLRMFHRSWGLMLIQVNLQAPCMLLDFPTLDRFIEEIRDHEYDIVGISSIVPNLHKVEKMCQLVRQYRPGTTIVVGGHVANIPDLAERIDADHVVRGDGVGWFRRFLGEPLDQPIRHPYIQAGLNTRVMGITQKVVPEKEAATVIPSVGCPMGCNFCSTSAMFGGKGHFINFYESGDELFDIMCQLERSMKTTSFFMMDENFLLHRRRALRLLELMERNGKAWNMFVFSSANALRTYSMEQLVSLGVSRVWMGLEGKDSQYNKLDGADCYAIVRELQSHGIHVLGSTIIGLEDHTPENIDEVIEHAVRYDSDFHQFMLYTPLPGTPLHAELSAQGRMKDESEFDVSDIHGQLVFSYRHPHIPDGQETELLLRAFHRDFEVNGPTITRFIRTTLAGWKRYKHHPDERIRRHFAWEGQDLATSFAALAWAAKGYYRNRPAMREKMSRLLNEIHEEFGWKSRLFAAAAGRYVLRQTRREEKRLARGWTYEPPTFYEGNEASERVAASAGRRASRSGYATPCRGPAQAAEAAAAPAAAVSGERQSVDVPRGAVLS
jgi:hypothetical protein